MSAKKRKANRSTRGNVERRVVKGPWLSDERLLGVLSTAGNVQAVYVCRHGRWVRAVGDDPVPLRRA